MIVEVKSVTMASPSYRARTWDSVVAGKERAAVRQYGLSAEGTVVRPFVVDVSTFAVNDGGCCLLRELQAERDAQGCKGADDGVSLAAAVVAAVSEAWGDAQMVSEAMLRRARADRAAAGSAALRPFGPPPDAVAARVGGVAEVEDDGLRREAPRREVRGGPQNFDSGRLGTVGRGVGRGARGPRVGAR
jgi:hypothetical protein